MIADELRALADEVADLGGRRCDPDEWHDLIERLTSLADRLQGRVVVDPDEFIAQLKAEVARQFDEMQRMASEAAERYEGDGE